MLWRKIRWEGDKGSMSNGVAPLVRGVREVVISKVIFKHKSVGVKRGSHGGNLEKSVIGRGRGKNRAPDVGPCAWHV